MNNTPSPAGLSPRAVEQLTSLAFDRATGFRRLRAINRSRLKQRENLTLLEGERHRAAELLADAERRGVREDRIAPLKEKAREAAAAVAGATQRLATLEREEELIKAWLDPCARTVDAMLGLTGCSSIESLLPDFDDGGDVDVDAVQAHAAAATWARATGGAR